MAARKREIIVLLTRQALVCVQTPAPFYFNRPVVETDCYRVPVAVNNVENNGAERADASWTSGVLSSGISRAGALVSPGQ